MTIGHIVQMTNKEEGENFKEWQQLIIEPPFMGRISATLFENKHKKNVNEPDFILYENITKRGDKEKFNNKIFKPRSIGGIWRRTSKDGKTNFLAGSIDTPMVYGGKFNFSLFETKVPDNGKAEDYFWTYDAVWNPFKPNNNNNSNSYSHSDYAEPSSYTPGPSGKEIPVYVENDSTWEYN